MTTRREVISIVSGVALVRALPALAQQTKRPPLVGLVFTPGSLERMLGADPSSLPARGFVHGLRDLGWTDGINVEIERRVAETDPDRLSAQFIQLQSLGAKVFVLAGARWIQDAAIRVTTGVPIVTLFHEDPVSAGLIASLSRPGGNLTGITSTTGPELDDKRLQLVSELLPGLARVVFLGPENQIKPFRANAAYSSSVVVPVQVDLINQYEKAFATILDLKPGALMVGGGPLNYANFKRIVAFAAQIKLPTVFAIREAVEDGGLMSYGPSIPGAFRQMAGHVAKILNGAKPADLPVEQPTKFELVINGKTAAALGIKLPTSLLARADEVIE